MSRDGKRIDSIRFPDGYYMRSYKEGDGAGWCKCCADGSLGIEEISESAFANKMLTDKNVNPANIFFLISPAGEIAGTVTYQYTDREDTGCIHMVAIEKSYRGRGLALPLNLYAVQRMLGDGKKKIVLTTDDWRIPAIRTYLHVGFIPVVEPGDTDMANRWAVIFEQIEHMEAKKCL